VDAALTSRGRLELPTLPLRGRRIMSTAETTGDVIPMKSIKRGRAKETTDISYALVQLTMELFPEGQKVAFVAAQKADLALKRNRSHRIVAGVAATTFGIGVTPIPFSDAVPIVSAQVGMLAAISAAYGMSFSVSSLNTLVTSAVGGTAATMTGRAVVGGLLKLFPGAGTVIGGVISGSTAAAITTSLGETYIAALDALFARHAGEPPSQEEVLEEVQRRFGRS
jgi:uncharacterized protein (DUF697 family)